MWSKSLKVYDSGRGEWLGGIERERMREGVWMGCMCGGGKVRGKESGAGWRVREGGRQGESIRGYIQRESDQHDDKI